MTDAERAELDRLRQLEADEQPADLNDISTVACLAWTGVKRVDDAAWDLLPMDVQHKLKDLAEKAIAGRSETEGDYAPVGFFEAVRAVAPKTPEDLSGDTSTHAPNKDAERVDPDGPPVVHGDGTAPPDLLEGDVRPPGSGILETQDPPTELPPIQVDESQSDLSLSELQAANEPRADVNDEALATSEPEFQEKAGYLKGPLPEDFPCRDPLHDFGINTYRQLYKQRDTEEGLLVVPGIGPAMAAKIEEHLSR